MLAEYDEQHSVIYPTIIPSLNRLKSLFFTATVQTVNTEVSLLFHWCKTSQPGHSMLTLVADDRCQRIGPMKASQLVELSWQQHPMSSSAMILSLDGFKALFSCNKYQSVNLQVSLSFPQQNMINMLTLEAIVSAVDDRRKVSTLRIAACPLHPLSEHDTVVGRLP